MEIEGIVQHTLAGLYVRHERAKNDVDLCEREIHKWHQVRMIHANEEVQHAIQGLTSIRQLVTGETHIKYFLAVKPEDIYTFMGFHLDSIQFYMDLRTQCEGTNRKPEREAELNLSISDC
jgi:hypothetical protein